MATAAERQPAETNVTTPKTDVGILIALKEEFHELRKELTSLMAGRPQVDAHGQSRFPFEFRDVAGIQRRGVVKFIDDMGQNEARSAAQAMAREFAPILMVNVGTAGSLTSNVRLGDVVVVDSADEYDHREKVTEDGPRFGGDIKEPSDGKTWINRKIKDLDVGRPDIHDLWRRMCVVPPELHGLQKAGAISGRVAIHGGPIASGNKVVATADFKNRLLRRNRNFLAVEMEAHGFFQGVAETTSQDPAPWTLSLKGISDSADEHKNELEATSKNANRAWAMGNACRLLRVLLEMVDLFSPGGAVPDQRWQRLSATSEKCMPEHMRRLQPAELARWRALYSQVASPPAQGTDDTVSACLKVIENTSPNSRLFVVDGESGSGKSAFLSLLYRSLADGAGRDRAVLLLDLAKYDSRIYSEPAESFEAQALYELVRDLEPLQKLLDENSTRTALLLVDSFEGYGKRRRSSPPSGTIPGSRAATSAAVRRSSRPKGNP